MSPPGLVQLPDRPESVDTHLETMGGSNAALSLRTAGNVCKPGAPSFPQMRQRLRRGWRICVRHGRSARLPAGLASLAVLLAACNTAPKPKTITMAALESAPSAPTAGIERLIVSDPLALQEMCTPLGRRLGLVQVRCRSDWIRLARAVPQIGPCPDLRHGMLVGLACWAGTPVDGHWPLRIDAVRVHDGAGLVEADFHGGSYLPDGTTFLEIAHVAGMSAVLAVDINGTTFYPE